MGEMFLDDGDIRLYHGDVREVLAGMPDESVDCVVTSPPYWGLRDYSVEGQLGLEPTPDLFVANMVAVFREVRRVLAPHGTCWVNLGDSYNANQGTGFNGQKRQDHANRHTVMPRPDWLKQKDLVGIPWRVAFALQADGWYLRADIIWAKPNPMPESVTDRPTKAHEYVFLLTKEPRYFFDQEAVREPNSPGSVERFGIEEGVGSTKTWNTDNNKRDGRTDGTKGTEGFRDHVPHGRNVRSVWQIATQPYPEAHFATYPEELVRRCVLAGCPVRVCRVCRKPSERIVEQAPNPYPGSSHDHTEDLTGPGAQRHASGVPSGTIMAKRFHERGPNETVGWSDCGHNDWRPGVTLDPFVGSGTTCKVARDHGRHSIGIDLSADYLALAARRLQQLSLLT